MDKTDSYRPRSGDRVSLRGVITAAMKTGRGEWFVSLVLVGATGPEKQTRIQVRSTELKLVRPAPKTPKRLRLTHPKREAR